MRPFNLASVATPDTVGFFTGRAFQWPRPNSLGPSVINKASNLCFLSATGILFFGCLLLVGVQCKDDEVKVPEVPANKTLTPKERSNKHFWDYLSQLEAKTKLLV